MLLARCERSSLWTIAKFTGIVGETGARLDHPWAGASDHARGRCCVPAPPPASVGAFAWRCPVRIRPANTASVRCWARQSARGDEGLRRDAITPFLYFNL